MAKATKDKTPKGKRGKKPTEQDESKIDESVMVEEKTTKGKKDFTVIKTKEEEKPALPEENASDDELSDYDETNKLPVKQQNTQHITTSFTDFSLHDQLLLNIKNAQFENPSPVQSMAIPKFLLEKDILCQAKSGTGKTAVFVLSSIELAMRKREASTKDNSGSVVMNKFVVCCNTVEMVEQIKAEYKRFTNNITIESDFIIGDIRQLLAYDYRSNNTIFNLIVDECDQVIFNKLFTDLYNKIHPVSTTMFTATLIKKSKEECLKYLKNPYEIYVDDDTQLTLYGLKQFFKETAEKEKARYIKELYSSENDKDFTVNIGKINKSIIFCNKTQNAKYLKNIFSEIGIKSFYVTEFESPKERLNTIRVFKETKNVVLCTTDILSRGIDISDIDLVINYDIPPTPQTYLHRVGRAGRFETEGAAINLVNGIADRMRIREVMERYEVEINRL